MMNRILLYIVLLVFISSCGYRSNIMLRADKDYPYAVKKDSAVNYEYTIQPNDFLDFRLYTNDGFKLVDLTTLNENLNISADHISINYLVEHDGNVKLPLLGRVYVQGMTIKEVQQFLEDKYSKYYIEPFVLAKVINRRVIVFAGGEGSGKVVPLLNTNTTLIEGIALAGGLGTEGKARKIKLVRGNPKNPEVYLIDLSTIEGMKQADFILQSNDIIYVEHRIRITREFATDIAPILSLVATTLTLLIAFNRF